MECYEMDKEAIKSGLDAVIKLVDLDMLRGVAVIALYKDGRVFEGGDCDDYMMMCRKLRECARCIETRVLCSDEAEDVYGLQSVTMSTQGGKGELN